MPKASKANGGTSHLPGARVEQDRTNITGEDVYVDGRLTVADRLTLTSGGVDVDVQEALSTVLSSGVITGGQVNLNQENPKAIDLGALTGYIVDLTTDQSNPTVQRVDTEDQTIELDASAQTRSITWWLMDATGAVTQQASRPTPEERRASIVLGATTYDTVSEILLIDQTLPTVLAQPANQLADLMDGLGPFRMSGLRVSANGANLSLNYSSGTMFARAFNHYDGPTITRDPHTVHLNAATGFQFRRILRAQAASTPPLVTTVDPANYDLNGTLTAVGGGSNAATIQRIWLFGTTDNAAAVAVQYGQQFYNSLQAAVDAVGAGTFVPHPVADDAVLVGYLCVIRTATSLTDPLQATFVHPGRFPTP